MGRHTSLQSILETRLFKMVVRGVGDLKFLFGHYQKRQAIGQTPVFIPGLSILLKGFFKLDLVSPHDASG
jgi:hypothetical protein